MNALKQNLIHLVIIIAVVIVALWANPAPKDEVHGIFLPTTNTQYPAINAKNVAVLSSLPIVYTKIGNIRTALHFSDTSQEAFNMDCQISAKYAQKLAGIAGANAIVLSPREWCGRSVGSVGPLDGTSLRATAIHIENV
jgi:hypothetical protein